MFLLQRTLFRFGLSSRAESTQAVLETLREEEFAPVKNAPGTATDSSVLGASGPGRKVLRVSAESTKIREPTSHQPKTPSND